MTIIEATSGNTGIGLTLVGVQKGYKVICVIPENMSEERTKIIHAFGGEIVACPAEGSLKACLDRIQGITKISPEKYFVANQFGNPHNPEIHYVQTAPEIWKDMSGEIDIFVVGAGSGGTLQGIGKYLKEKKPTIKIVAVEPKNSAALLGKEPGLHQIQGIGNGFIPDVLDVNLVDMVFTVSDEEAIPNNPQTCSRGGIAGRNFFGSQCICSDPHGKWV